MMPFFENMKRTEFGLAEVAAVFAKAWRISLTARLRLSVVLDDDGHAAGAVALEGDFFVVAPGSSPVPRWMARLMLSRHVLRLGGGDGGAQARIAVGIATGLAAMVISLISRVKILPRFASSAPFLCLIVAHFEWPDMGTSESILSGVLGRKAGNRGIPRLLDRLSIAGAEPGWYCRSGGESGSEKPVSKEAVGDEPVSGKLMRAQFWSFRGAEEGDRLVSAYAENLILEVA